MSLILNGERISDRILDRELLRLSSGLEMDAPHAGNIDLASLRSFALHNVVDRVLLLQTAVTYGLQINDNEADSELRRRWQINRDTVCDPVMMQAIREDLLLERARMYLTRHVPRPGRAEVERFYKANQHLYLLPEAVEAAHVFCGFSNSEEELTSAATIRQAEAELRKGQQFQRVANRHSDCKGVGGALGWVVRGQMVQEFEDVIFSLPLGRSSEVFRTIFGFHIALVTRRRKEGFSAFEAVRQEIAHRLSDEAKRNALTHVLAKLRAESEITYTEGHANA